MQLGQENLKWKNEELIQAFRDKSRKQLQTQELYDKLKQRAMLGQVQNAASDAVDHSIQTSVAASRITDSIDGQNQHPSQPPLFSGIRDARIQRHHPSPPNVIDMANIMGRRGTGDWVGFRSNQENIAR
jgi:E3 ubiquitin-protein ligase CCNP1IP1